MSPTSEDEDSLHAKDSGNKPEEEAAVADATQKQAAKRRTKTGCLSEFSSDHRSLSSQTFIPAELEYTNIVSKSLPQKTNKVWRGKAREYFSCPGFTYAS